MLKYMFPLLVVLAACSGQEKTENPKEKPAPKVVVSFKDEEDMDERIVEIDAIVAQADMIASSLYYSKGDEGESVQVDGHMNSDNTILKVEEFFNDGGGGNSGIRTYYLNNGQPFVTIEKFNDVSGTTPQFVDRMSYYDTKGNVIKTKERRGNFEEVVENMQYKPVGLHGIKIDRALRAMNQEKEFETTFQGFVDAEVFTYLSVGENKPDGFRSALRCDFKDLLILTLLDNEEAYLGEKLRVNYQKETQQNGFQFQVYAGGKFAEEK